MCGCGLLLQNAVQMLRPGARACACCPGSLPAVLHAGLHSMAQRPRAGVAAASLGAGLRHCGELVCIGRAEDTQLLPHVRRSFIAFGVAPSSSKPTACLSSCHEITFLPVTSVDHAVL